MQIDKKKIVFSGVLLIIMIFMVVYYYLMVKPSSTQDMFLKQTELPELEAQKVEFSSKKEAVDALEKEREHNNAPSMYNESLLGATGLFDPDLLEKEKERIVDSIYDLGKSRYANLLPKKVKKVAPKNTQKKTMNTDENVNTPMEIALEQQLFFAISPNLKAAGKQLNIEVVVDGEQTVKINDRLQMRTTKDILLGDSLLPKNTLLYGMVKFRPNRVVLEVEYIEHKPVKLTAFDLADGLEGIYVQNSFKGDIRNEALSGVIDDINIPGIPQLNGIKRVFQRNNRNIKVTVNANYKLILKTKS